MKVERQVVVVADSGRTRVYAFEPEKTGRQVHVPPLREVATLINPERRRKDSEMFTDNRPGLRQDSGGGPAHGVDDRRNSHKDELDRRFAVEIIDQVADISRGLGAKRILLAASPHMLGFLRPKTAKWSENGTEVEEVGRDLTHLTAAKLHDHLASDDLIPPRSRQGQGGR